MGCPDCLSDSKQAFFLTAELVVHRVHFVAVPALQSQCSERFLACNLPPWGKLMQTTKHAFSPATITEHHMYDTTCCPC